MNRERKSPSLGRGVCFGVFGWRELKDGCVRTPEITGGSGGVPGRWCLPCSLERKLWGALAYVATKCREGIPRTCPRSLCGKAWEQKLQFGGVERWGDGPEVGDVYRVAGGSILEES